MSGEADSGLKSGTAQNCAYHKTQTMIREKQSGAHPDLSPDARSPNFSSVFFPKKNFIGIPKTTAFIKYSRTNVRRSRFRTQVRNSTELCLLTVQNYDQGYAIQALESSDRQSQGTGPPVINSITSNKKGSTWSLFYSL